MEIFLHEVWYFQVLCDSLNRIFTKIKKNVNYTSSTINFHNNLLALLQTVCWIRYKKARRHGQHNGQENGQQLNESCIIVLLLLKTNTHKHYTEPKTALNITSRCVCPSEAPVPPRCHLPLRLT